MYQPIWPTGQINDGLSIHGILKSLKLMRHILYVKVENLSGTLSQNK